MEETTMDRRRRALLKGAAAFTALPWIDPAFAHAQERKVLIVVSQNDISNFDPHAGSDDATLMLWRNTYDALLRFEGNPPKLMPNLASSWEVSDDERTFVFHLDPNARFHDGSPVDAEAVCYSFERLLRLRKGSAWMIAGIVEPKGVEAVDERTVRFTLKKSFAPFLHVLPWLFVVNPRLVEANKGNDDGQTFLRSTIAGSGPFRLRRAEPSNLYELERVRDGWHKGGGNLDRAVWKIVRETSIQRLMVEHGDAHVAVNLSSDDMLSVKRHPHVVSVIEPEYLLFLLRLNTKHGPFTDVNLRKAVSYALDYQGMLDESGFAKLSVGPIPAGMKGFDSTLPVYRTDLVKAREYLARTPYANGGLKLTMTHISGHEQERRWSLVLLDSLRRLGIDLEIHQSTWPDIVAAARTPQTCPDILAVFAGADYDDPDDMAFNFYHSSRNGNWANPTYADPEVDRIIMEARSEANESRRAALYAQFQRKVVGEAPDLWVVTTYRKLALRANVGGFVFTPLRPAALDLLPLSVT
ncbi:ABC transporter substrate-binding protein [Paraburkholderia phytofirmans]